MKCVLFPQNHFFLMCFFRLRSFIFLVSIGPRRWQEAKQVPLDPFTRLPWPCILTSFCFFPTARYLDWKFQALYRLIVRHCSEPGLWSLDATQTLTLTPPLSLVLSLHVITVQMQP